MRLKRWKMFSRLLPPPSPSSVLFRLTFLFHSVGAVKLKHVISCIPHALYTNPTLTHNDSFRVWVLRVSLTFVCDQVNKPSLFPLPSFSLGFPFFIFLFFFPFFAKLSDCPFKHDWKSNQKNLHNRTLSLR